VSGLSGDEIRARPTVGRHVVLACSILLRDSWEVALPLAAVFGAAFLVRITSEQLVGHEP
jgi:hypothetical protein